MTLLVSAALVEPVVASGEPPEPEQDVYTQPLVQAGAATFVGSYGAALGVAVSSLDRDDRGLYVPVVGPWLALAAHVPCDSGCSHATRNDVLLAADGIAQAVGVGMIAAGVIAERHERARRGAHLAVTPTYVGVFGRF